MHILLTIHRCASHLNQQLDTPQDISHLALGKKDNTPIHNNIGIGSIHTKKIGKSRNRNAFIRARIAIPMRL